MKLNVKHSPAQHPWSTTILFHTDYEIADRCPYTDKSATGKNPEDCEDAACDHGVAPDQKHCTDSPVESRTRGTCRLAYPFCSSANPFLAVLEHLIATQGCKGY